MKTITATIGSNDPTFQKERVEKRFPLMDKLRRLNLKNLAIGMAFWRIEK